MLENGQNDGFGWNIWPTLGQIISGTKYDRDKLNFTVENGGQYNQV